jgi:hypothetical protein
MGGKIIHSAIRIVDVWYVPADEDERNRSNIKLYALTIVKALPSEETYAAVVHHESPDGTVAEVGRQDDVRFQVIENDPTIPVGFTAGMEVVIAARLTGTHNIRVSVGGREMARAYFTLLPRRSSTPTP